MSRPADMPPPERFGHGTRSRYVCGCRCSPCRAANTKAYHERQARAKALAAEQAAPIVPISKPWRAPDGSTRMRSPSSFVGSSTARYGTSSRTGYGSASSSSSANGRPMGVGARKRLGASAGIGNGFNASAHDSKASSSATASAKSAGAFSKGRRRMRSLDGGRIERRAVVVAGTRKGTRRAEISSPWTASPRHGTNGRGNTA